MQFQTGTNATVKVSYTPEDVKITEQKYFGIWDGLQLQTAKGIEVRKIKSYYLKQCFLIQSQGLDENEAMVSNEVF